MHVIVLATQEPLTASYPEIQAVQNDAGAQVRHFGSVQATTQEPLVAVNPETQRVQKDAGAHVTQLESVQGNLQVPETTLYPGWHAEHVAAGEQVIQLGSLHGMQEVELCRKYDVTQPVHTVMFLPQRAQFATAQGPQLWRSMRP